MALSSVVSLKSTYLDDSINQTMPLCMKRNRNHLFVAFVTSAYAGGFCSYSGIRSRFFEPTRETKIVLKIRVVRKSGIKLQRWTEEDKRFLV